MMNSSAHANVRTRTWGGAGLITETTITDYTENADADSVGLHLLVMSLEVFWSRPLPASGEVTLGRSSKATVRIEDGLASREHAKIQVGTNGGSPMLTIEDLHSANGTRVRNALIEPRVPVTIAPGEAFMIGSTVLMVMPGQPTVGHRRIWSHAYFETRVDEECVRASKAHASFALARIRFSGPAPWTRVTPILATELTAPHVFASYGPKDYEILFTDPRPGEPEAAIQKLIDGFQGAGLEAKSAVAWYPEDGRSGDALLGAANAGLRGAGRKITLELPLTEGNEMRRVRAMAARAAPANINVLILGEMGVGKDVLARLIHQLSPRASKPFVALNCASLTESLMESELFGHEKGAFTGAATAKVGLFESANGGTVFLDEIGEMPPAMQAKLLQAIELREVRPVGSLRTRPIDVRFLSATNVNIEAAVAKGTFRGDLMYRLNTLTLAIPPLRERKEEIGVLAEAFVAQNWRDLARAGSPTITPEAMACLLGYAWPGNIRELKNVMERAVVLCDGAEILPEHLPLEKMRPTRAQAVPEETAQRATPTGNRVLRNLPPLDDPDDEAERQRILDALEQCAWSQTRAAELLGISRRTLVTKLGRYKIPRPHKDYHEDDADKTIAGKRIDDLAGSSEPAPGE